jgi:hypothetical protein
MTKLPTPVDMGGPRPKKVNTSKLITEIMQRLQQISAAKATPELYDDIITMSQDLPADKRPSMLLTTIAQTFMKGMEEVDSALRLGDKRVEFDALVPPTGWLHDYIEWTRSTEPPTAFHFFVGATAIGASLGRNVFFDKGAYQVFPNLCTIIVAPTGRCRKTSACNLGIGLYSKIGGTLLADKTTPEALVDGLKENVNATGLIYAPELAVFLGKQKYNEGMIPLLTALLDCPKEWTSKTLGRGDVVLTNVALTALLCSTVDWLQTAIPKDAFGGGFMSRFLFVVQESTPRIFPLPPALDPETKKSLTSRLTKIRSKKGQIYFTADATDWYTKWYRQRSAFHAEKQYAGYYERKPDHMIRLATIMKAATDEELKLDAIDLYNAERILTWLEQWLPATFDEMTTSASGEDQSRILRQLKNAGGALDHSQLLRRNSTKMNAEQFKRSVGTLREAKLLEYDATTRTYHLTAEGWE